MTSPYFSLMIRRLIFEAGYKTDNGSLFNVGYSYRRLVSTAATTTQLTNEASALSDR